MNILIVGCGYIGLPLGLRLKARGHEVTGWVFSEESGRQLAASGLKPIVGDLALAENWEKIQQTFDAIFYCPSTKGGTPENYRRIYVEGMKHAIAKLKAEGRFLYTSSTSVYGQKDGSRVDENSLTEPGTESGNILLEAERTTLTVRGAVMRLGAIYGPGRGVILKRFLESSGPIPGDPDRFLNQIHREDAVSAALFLLEHEASPGGIFNVTDSHPATHREMYQWLAEALKKPLPEFSGEPAARKRGDNNRRIANTKLLGLGWVPLYPDFRKGYETLI